MLVSLVVQIGKRRAEKRSTCDVFGFVVELEALIVGIGIYNVGAHTSVEQNGKRFEALDLDC